jgi:Bacterial Ig-like domain (group 3)
MRRRWGGAIQRTMLAVVTILAAAAWVPTVAVASSGRADRAVVDPVESLVTFVVAPPAPVAWQELTLGATVAPATGEGPVPTGTVAFRADFIPVGTQQLNENGHAETHTSIGAGTHIFDASYSGDGAYLPRLADAMVTVQKASSVVDVTSLSNPAVEGTDIPWLVDVLPQAPSEGIPSGTVSIALDAFPLGDFELDEAGQVALEISDLEAGSHVVLVSYNGDFDYLPNDATFTQVVVTPPVPPTQTPSAVASSVTPKPPVVAPAVRPLSLARLLAMLRPRTLTAHGGTVTIGTVTNPPVHSLSVDLVAAAGIRAVGSAATTSLGRVTITVAPGKSRAIKVRLNRAGRRALRTHRSLRVQVRLKAVDSTGHTVKTTIKRTLKPFRR